ncbi:MAG: hypothetical protein WC919_04045 [Candidatus Paceibacterota bacterium]
MLCLNPVKLSQYKYVDSLPSNRSMIHCRSLERERLACCVVSIVTMITAHNCVVMRRMLPNAL